MSAQDKVVAVLLDDMAIKPMLQYNPQCDRFYGFPNSGHRDDFENNDPKILATEAVTIMITNLHHGKRFKQVIMIFLFPF